MTLTTSYGRNSYTGIIHRKNMTNNYEQTLQTTADDEDTEELYTDLNIEFFSNTEADNISDDTNNDDIKVVKKDILSEINADNNDDSKDTEYYCDLYGISDSNKSTITYPHFNEQTEDSNTIIQNILSIGLQNAYTIPVSNNLWISQYPELPTGCEITSLTMLLNYCYETTSDNSIDKTLLADEYMDKDISGFNETFSEAFHGNPFSSNGWGCYAPVITNAANRYIENQNVVKNFRAYDITGTDFSTIIQNICNQHPVLIWTTINRAEKPQKIMIDFDNGESEYWSCPEHCVMLTGYDLKKETVTLYDPTSGIKTEDMKLFIDRYYDLGMQAVIIK